LSSNPSESQVLGYLQSLSNWGRWGENDRLGTLNFITPQKTLSAVSLVTQGLTVSLSFDITPGLPRPQSRPQVLHRYMEFSDRRLGSREIVPSRRVREYVGLVAHSSATHLDALGHISVDGRYYNNVPEDSTTSVAGATQLGITNLQKGVVTRGVLLDVPGLYGRPWLEAGHRVMPDELAAAAERQEIVVEEGDACLLYTGNFERIDQEGPHPDDHWAGYAGACLPWFASMRVALVATDGRNDAIPSGYDRLEPLHDVGIVAMGLCLIDNMALRELVQVCRALRRWTFLFVVLPWRLDGCTSSPVNPLAVF
jgi:kynurenine formamidase